MADSMLPTRRAWRLLWILQGQTFDGLRLTQIAAALEATPTAALRLLETAADEGVVERIPNKENYWRLTPRTVQLAFALQHELDAIKRRVDETTNRYTRTPI